MRFGSALAVAVLMIATSPYSPLHAQNASAAKPQLPPKNGDAAALAAFHSAIDNYLGLRKKISHEVPPLTVTPKAAEITAASDALARAVQRARPRARQGAFFTPEVASVIRRQLEQVLQSTDREAIVALINEEASTVTRPSIYMRFPAAGVLATTPAVVLQTLPPLPRELEYRFIGTTLVLRDIDAALVLDYVPNAFRDR